MSKVDRVVELSKVVTKAKTRLNEFKSDFGYGGVLPTIQIAIKKYMSHCTHEIKDRALTMAMLDAMHNQYVKDLVDAEQNLTDAINGEDV